MASFIRMVPTASGARAAGIPIGCVTAPANRHGSPLLRPTLEHLARFETCFGIGLPDRITVQLDVGYDSAKTNAVTITRRLIRCAWTTHRWDTHRWDTRPTRRP